MSYKNQIFEKLENYPKNQNLDISILDDAKKLAEELCGIKAKEKKRKKGIYFKTALASLSACLVFAVIFLPIYFSLPSKETSIYYSADRVKTEEISDIDAFVAKENLKIKCFYGDVNADTNAANYIIETGKLAFLTQNLIFLSTEGFDTVELGIVPSKDSFEVFESFVYFTNDAQINGVAIKYVESIADNQMIIKATFNFDSVSYFLMITTINSEGKLDGYVKMLLT